MAGLTSEELRFALWFLLAGIIIGFAASSVWEWLFYRGKRWGLEDEDPFALAGAAPAERSADAARLEIERRAAPKNPLLAATQATVAVPPQAARAEETPVQPVTGAATPLVAPASPHAERPMSVVRPARPVETETSGRSRGLPDDLTRITGLSPAHQQRLFQAHIFTWHQVATSETEVLTQITGAGEDVFVSQWPAQARALATHHQRQNASYSGPVPEDLTQIQGLTRAHAAALNQVGIVTFGQLAMASGAELAALFEEQDGDSPPDYEAWLRTASFLARRNGHSAAGHPATVDSEARILSTDDGSSQISPAEF